MNHILKGLRIITWSIALFFYNFQVPFMDYAWLITFGLALFMLLDVKKVFKIFDNMKIGLLYIIVLAFCLLNLLYSVSNGTELPNALRFLVILMLIPVCPFFVNRDSNVLYKIFAVLTFSKAVMLIAIALMLITAGSYTELRQWARLGDYGDIYFAYGFIPRVQLKGNALIVIAFMISFYKNRKFTFYNVILLIGTLCAGNFAFILGLAVFFVWEYFKTFKFSRKLMVKKILVGIILIVGMVGFTAYAFSEQNQKSGVYGSNGMRQIQYEILTDTNELYGSGLGRPAYGASRMGLGYVNSQYYELQTLYIYYQVGIFGLLAFYILMLYSMETSCTKSGFILFLIYLLYSFFNPYCFDTTQMIAMIVISSQFYRWTIKS